MKKTFKSFFFVILLLVFSFSSLAAEVTDEELRILGKQERPDLVPVIHYDVSQPLREIPPAPEKAGVKRIVPNRPILKTEQALKETAISQTLDPALQMSEGLTAAPSPLSSFDGIGNGIAGYTVNVAPPDTVHDVGPNHIVQAVNSHFAVYNKSGTLLYGPVAINTLWSGFGGGCQSNNDGDPTVNYDQMADRWVIMQFSVSTTPYLQCVAVSTSPDPTGSYYRFSYQYTDFNDYPKVGIWPDSYFVTYNMFTNTSGYGYVCALERSKLLAGQANTQRCFSTGASGMGLLPSDMDGTTQPAAGSPNYIMRFEDSTDQLQMWKFTANWSGSASFTGPTNISVAAFTEACVSASRGACIPQGGTTNKLESLGDRLMNRLAYRRFSTHESLVVSHTVGGDTAAQIRWYEIRNPNGTPSVYQQGTYAPNSNWRWMPSIAMDKDGNIAIGYSLSSSSISPDIYVTGRQVSDPLGTMGTETTMLSGVTRGSQTGTLKRWGDYSAMVVDPSDDCTFWYTTEYIPSNGSFNWRTRIGSFKFSSCGGGSGDTTPPTTSITSPTAGSTVNGTITVSASASDNVGVTNVEFYVDGSLIGSDSTSPYSINWNTTTVSNGSHSLTSRAYDAAGNNTTSSAVSVTVSNAGQASYDSTLKAPKCGTVNSFCDSGTLLDGRGTMAPGEPNQPNTINNSCADGSSGTYHSDESLDKLRVATNDGSSLAGGKTVTVSATAWCWGTADSLDLYYTSNASSPSWTLIGTQTCDVSGQAKTFTATYTLPSTGTLHAIRGNFRYQGSASSCSTGSYDDHDDLIFAVNQSTSDTTPPSTSITAPASGSTVSGTITVSASASDNVGVTKVEFYLDGTTLLGSVTTSPYSISWNTTTASNGSHSLTSKAYDAAGNTATSIAVSVTVSNTTACGSTSNLHANPGFESGSSTGWSKYSSTGNTSGIITNSTSRSPHSGSWYAWLNGYGSSTTQYIATSSTTMLIPSTACTATMKFWLKIDTAETTITTAYDTVKAQYRYKTCSSCTWSSWTTVATYSNLNASSTYQLKSFDLTGQKGRYIQFRFYGKEDASKQTSFLIDDVALEVTQ